MAPFPIRSSMIFLDCNAMLFDEWFFFSAELLLSPYAGWKAHKHHMWRAWWHGHVHGRFDESMTANVANMVQIFSWAYTPTFLPLVVNRWYPHMLHLSFDPFCWYHFSVLMSIVPTEFKRFSRLLLSSYDRWKPRMKEQPGMCRPNYGLYGLPFDFTSIIQDKARRQRGHCMCSRTEQLD